MLDNANAPMPTHAPVGRPVPAADPVDGDPAALMGEAPTPDGVGADDAPEPSLDSDLAGLDALETQVTSRPPLARRAWRATWPKLIALALILAVWQIAVWAHWKPFILQTPRAVAVQLWDLLGQSTFWAEVWNTAQRAVVGYAIAVVVGTVIGTAVARVPVLRAGIGSLITGMQTMPSVLWFPLAYMVFGNTSAAIVLMMVLSAAPAVANGVITGIDQVPPLLLRAGRILGARGWSLQRRVVLPSAFPTMLGGLKQAWAFAWHALMTGEFLVQVSSQLGLGGRIDNALTQGYYAIVVALMIVIVIIGVVVDMGFSWIDRSVRRRYGLLDASTT
jgi:NitT/TauT family transport system permease protein